MPGTQTPETRVIRSLPKPGDHKAITMATIAKAAGVSQGAISSLLNDRDYGIRVSDKTRDRVFKVCRELGYIPNDLRAVVRMYPHLGDLCILVASDRPGVACDPLQARALDAAASCSPFPGQPVTIARFSVKADYSGDAEPLPYPVQCGVASKHLFIGPPNVSLAQTILRRGFPIAVVGHELAMPGVSSFVPDYTQAARIAVETLVGLGHKNIAFLPGPFGAADRAIVELNRGVKLGCDAAGIPIRADNLVYNDLTPSDGAAAVAALAARADAPTAIVALSDAAGAGALWKAREMGLGPGKLSVLGCGGDPVGGGFGDGLSTVRIPVEEMVVAAARDLEKRVLTEELGETRLSTFVPTFVDRGSCAPPQS